MPLTIQDATPEDEAQWRDLWAQYLQFYSVTLSDDVTTATWGRIIDPASPLRGRFVFDADQMLGFALHHTHLSTWVLAPDCYLEDLFLAEAARGVFAGLFAMPFDTLRAQYASAVTAGLVERSMLAARDFERAVSAMEQLTLGPLAGHR